jgi:light-regulated signal transduction histidine kinase (bacteriophytochrome)
VGVALLLFRDHVFSLAMSQSSLTLFSAIGVAVALVMGKLRRLNRALTATRDQLEAANRELNAANAALSQQGEMLWHSNEELQRFAYGLAHDLHNPLRSIGALTDLLVRRNAGRLDESSKECARMITDGVKRMDSMIHSLLEYAAAVGGDGDEVDIDCNVVVQRVLQDLRYAMETSGTVVKRDRLPVVCVNEAHLVQVFSNLIANAIKYRGPLKPEIQISAKEQGSDWVFVVKDNGIGLDMQYAKDIFGMFKRLHNSNGYEGSGVGLALCKVIIQRYDGRIWVESLPGRGSTFFFTLPKVAGGHRLHRIAATQTTP